MQKNELEERIFLQIYSESIDPDPQEKWPTLSRGGGDRKNFSLENNGNFFALPKIHAFVLIFSWGGAGCYGFTVMSPKKKSKFLFHLLNFFDVWFQIKCVTTPNFRC